MSIPKIIHQTWKDSAIPDSCQPYAHSWKHRHPKWKYKLWTDEDNRLFIRSRHPDYLDTYDSFPANIHRADVIRYFILFHYGGLYVDLDFECLKSFDSLVEKLDCFFGFEPFQHHNANIVCNALMASKKHHPLFMDFIDRAKRNRRIDDPVNATGPVMITKIILEKQYTDVTVFESKYFYPETARNHPVFILKDLKKEREDLKSAYANHHWMKSWVSRTAPPRFIGLR